jgi:hypothetical protein
VAADRRLPEALPLKRFALWLSIVVTCIGSAELTARLEDRLRLGVDWFAVPDHDRDLILHDDFGVRGRPNGRFKKWALNSFGFRHAEMSFEPPRDCIRVMVLGASETFGLYESAGKEYPKQLEAALRRVECHEVINGAVTGLTLKGQIQLWQGWVSKFRPDIVVVYPTPGFYLANNPPAFPKPPSRDSPVLPPWWTPRLIERAKDVFEFPAFIQRRRVAQRMAAITRSEPGWAFAALPADRLAQFEADLGTLTGVIQATGARVVLLTHATRFGGEPADDDAEALYAWRQFTPKASTEMLLEFEARAADATVRVASRQKAALVDARASMSGRREWFAEGDALHFNDEGARVIADLIAQCLLNDPAIRQHVRNKLGAGPPGNSAPARR